MDHILQRNTGGYRADGIFSTLSHIKADGTAVKDASTVEHAYPDGVGGWAPKLPPGEYVCKRGIHRLHDKVPFEAFEITGVKGHAGLLFHPGNVNKHSDGCVCTGQDFVEAPKSILHEDMVTNSRATFAAFMEMHEHEDTFLLRVLA